MHNSDGPSFITLKTSNIVVVLVCVLNTVYVSHSSSFKNAYNSGVILMVLKDDTRSRFKNIVFQYTCDKIGSTSRSERILTGRNRCQKFPTKTPMTVG